MNKQKRYYFSIVEEGIQNSKFFPFRAGRIEVFDRKSKSSYQIEEYRFCIPEELIDWFREKLDGYETDLPIRIKIDMFDLKHEKEKYYGK